MARHVAGPGSWLRLALAVAGTSGAVLTAACPPDGAPLPAAAGASPVANGGARLELGPDPGLAGFARVSQPRSFRLPADHGPHFEYQTEWWYFTGNLLAGDGARFGFQLTLFRRGLSPGAPPPGPGLASNQVYFAHFALTDVARERHVGVERFARGAAGLAGATGEPFAAWLEDWRVSACGEGAWCLAARDAGSGLSVELALRPQKPLVAHGERGVSPKSADAGNASYYVGYTRLSARGRLALGVHAAEVAGEAWFDHEWSTSALGAAALGWDWFSLQLEDGRELMYFQIRRADGSVEPVSAGTLVEADGRSRRLDRAEVQLTVGRRWTSRATGAAYPARWRLAVAAEGLELDVEPWLADQEMRTSFVYWEGAVRVSGRSRGRPVSGQGYVELTGYDRSMQGVF